MIRLGDKYQAQDVLSLGEKRLAALLPTDIDEWNRLYDHFEGTAELKKDAIAMVNIGRLRRNRHVYLTALYLCAQLKTESLLAGCRGADGHVEHLCPSDLVSCLDSRENLRCIDFNVKLVLMFHDVRPSCCKLDLQALRNTLFDTMNLPTSHDPLTDQGWAKDQCQALGLCVACMHHYDTSFKQVRQAILSDLGEYLHVDDATL